MPTKGQYTDADLQQAGQAQPAPYEAPPPDSTWQSIKETGGDILDLMKGATKGATHTLATIGSGEHALFPQALRNSSYGRNFEAGLLAMKDAAIPHNGFQKAGYTGEQVGEYLAPAGAEKALAKGITEAVPLMAKAAPLVRTGVGALSSGLVNKAQCGDFSTGATTGMAAGAIGEGLRALAPKMAESAIGITKGDRAFGKNPGREILDDTRGFRPSTVARTGQEALDRLNPELESAAANSPQMASLTPARDAIDNFMGMAQRRNAKSLHGQLGTLRDTLSTDFSTGQPIPAQVPPSRLLDLKRGFAEEHLGRWNPETHGGTIAARRNAYRALNDE